MKRTFIHELSNWPEFKWDSESLVGSVSEVRFSQGKYLGKMEALGFDLKTEACTDTLTHEIVHSSAIEGENLNLLEVRSSIARRVGFETAGLSKGSREVEGFVDLMLDATQNFQKPLTGERLRSWHTSLFPAGRNGFQKIIVGDWREDETGPMQVVSGPLGKEIVHFQAPPASRLKREMDRFLKWFNSPLTIDPLLFGGIAHLWFVTIHPFEDGNGRIARAITEMALSRSDQSTQRFYSLSSEILASKKDYYHQLESAQKGSLDITSWLGWFLQTLHRALNSSEQLLNSIILKAKIWQRINEKPINDRQRKIINRMLEPGWVGGMSTSKYSRFAGCSRDTALRDFSELLKWGIIKKNREGGRSTTYNLIKTEEF